MGVWAPGHIGLTLREKVETFNSEPPWSLQERLDHVSRNYEEARQVNLALDISAVQAAGFQVALWMRSHPLEFSLTA